VSRPLSIVHFITGLNVGGAEMMLYKLLAGIDRRRTRNVVVSLTNGGPLGARIADLGVPVHTAGIPRGRITIRGLARLIAVLRQERPQILQAWMYHANLLGLICGRLQRVPHVLWNIRNANEDLRRWPWSTVLTLRACARLSALPTAVVINSEAGRAFHERLGYHPRRWLVIPNGFDLKRFAPDPGARRTLRAELDVPPEAPLVGLMGRYHGIKDHPNFFRAAALIHERRPDVHFVLAGQDVTLDNPEIARLVAGQPVERALHLLGQREDVPCLMAALDLLVSSSLGEGFPNVVGEAMSAEVPCVVTDVGDSARIVGPTGVVVRPRDSCALADAVLQVLQLPPERRHELGRAARARIEQQFSIESVVRRYEDQYFSLGATERCVVG
jgi:glycosyltransferase involved in cell wall biosynthesis